MTQDERRQILDELGIDFSAQIEPAATLADLDPTAINTSQMRWKQRSQNAGLDSLSANQLLEDAELLVDAVQR